MYYSEQEEKIIRRFYRNSRKIKRSDVLELKWNEGKIYAHIDTCFDDDDDETSEEYTSFVFSFIKAEGNPPIIQLKPGDLFIINYHNFPDAILLNGEKIS